MNASPVTFSEDLFDRICERIANGESLRSICRSADMPSQTAVFKWLAADRVKEGGGLLVEQYTRAREAQADALFDEVLEIADDARNDWMEREEGEPTLNTEHIQRSRLRIDTRKWMAGKLRPKVYGEKLELEHGGELKTGPITGFVLEVMGEAKLQGDKAAE